MITQEPTKAMIDEWKETWFQYKDKLQPNRKSGKELLHYLQNKYDLTTVNDKKAVNTIISNITMNQYLSEKLPKGAAPICRTFFIENTGNGKAFYKDEDRDHCDIWSGEISRIFIGIDLVSGVFMVEGSSMLWDELNAFQGLDEKDFQNFVCVSQYIYSLKRFNLMQNVLHE